QVLLEGLVRGGRPLAQDSVGLLWDIFDLHTGHGAIMALEAPVHNRATAAVQRVSRSTGLEGKRAHTHRCSNTRQAFKQRPIHPPRKSQTKSQRRPTSGDTQLRQATVKPGQVPTERHRATPSDARNVTGGQGVAGSNPAVPTGSDIFSNTLLPHQSQQKSHSFVKWPFYGRADRVPRLPYGHVPTRHSRPRPTAKKSKITQPPHIRTATPPTANRPAPSAPTGGTAPAGSGQAKALKPGPPTPPQTRGGRHQSRPSDEPPRLWRSSPPPRYRPHPGYGESAVWVSSQMRCTGK